MVGDRYQRDYPLSTSPDGTQFVGGNQAHAEIWALYESLGRDASKITRRNFRALPAIAEIIALEGTEGATGPAWENRALQWYLDTDFGWPVRTPHIKAILDRLAALGLWDATFHDDMMDYETVYPDEWLGGTLVENAAGKIIRLSNGHVNVGMPTIQRGAHIPAAVGHWVEYSQPRQPVEFDAFSEPIAWIDVPPVKVWREGGGQMFHAEHFQSPAEVEEPACCHAWCPCDADGNLLPCKLLGTA